MEARPNRPTSASSGAPAEEGRLKRCQRRGHEVTDEPARGQRRYTLEEAAAEIRSTASLLEQRIAAGFLKLDADGRADEEALLRMLMLDRLHTAETHAKGAYSQCVHGFHHPPWAHSDDGCCSPPGTPWPPLVSSGD